MPKHILVRLAEDSVDPACFCRPCLETIARISREMNDTTEILAEVRRAILANQLDRGREPAPDFYLDTHGNTVFTAAYHLRRGTCCGNGCLHCPY